MQSTAHARLGELSMASSPTRHDTALSPFELKNMLVELAKHRSERMMLNAGRGTRTGWRWRWSRERPSSCWAHLPLSKPGKLHSVPTLAVCRKSVVWLKGCLA
jgi:hypothetical protein